MGRGCRRTQTRALGALLALWAGLHVGVAHAKVLLIVVDGLDAREVSDQETPALAHAWRESRWCPGAESVASMPTRTNSNHATLITGVETDVHGVTGNAVWDRKTERVRKLASAADVLTETIFTTARRAARGLRTAAAVGKPKLGAMFSGDGGRHLGPDELWDARAAPDAAKDDVTGYAYDGTTLAAARSLVEHAGADFLFINLSDVDRVSHGNGPQSPQAVETRRRTDAALGEFLAWLAARPEWQTSTIVITADHGFDTITNPPIRIADLLSARRLAGLQAVGDGGTGHVYVESPADPARDGAKLAHARRVALEHPGIAEALYVRPNPADGDARYAVGTVHPDWHLEHERSGELLVVARPGWVFVDGSKEEAKLIGNHGGPAERRVPAIVVGGAPSAGGPDCRRVSAADLGRTVQWCLGLPEVQRLDGRPIAEDGRGRVLSGLCPPPAAPRPGPSGVTPP